MPIRAALPLLAVALLAAGCAQRNPDYDPTTLVDGPSDGRPPETAPPDAPEPDLAGAESAQDTPPSSDARGAAAGSACTAPSDCSSGFCADGVCCNSACGELCWACNLAHAPGTCVPVPAGDDPRNQCPAEPVASCGRSGACDGRGRCELRPMGAECSPPACTAGVETAARTCDGAGTCRTGTTRSCAPASCDGDRCAVGCTSPAQCAPGMACVNSRCERSGPALHWRLDEPSGPTALDASGNGLAGTYSGTTPPATSTDVPPTSGFANPRSRSFGPTGRPGIVQPAIPASLKPAVDISISLWFKATTAATAGTDLVSCNGDLLVRLKPTAIELAKRKSTVEGQMYDVASANDLQRHLDGRWHHLLVVSSSTGMRVYLDGMPVGSDASTVPILYTGSEWWLGRAGLPSGRDFQGALDDFRVYPRALTGAEAMALAGGAP